MEGVKRDTNKRGGERRLSPRTAGALSLSWLFKSFSKEKSVASAGGRAGEDFHHWNKVTNGCAR